MLQASFSQRTFHFKHPAGTSRGQLYERKCWYIWIWHDHAPEVKGVGECSPLQGLSIDNPNAMQSELHSLCAQINDHPNWLQQRGKFFPSIRFGLETALDDLTHGGERIFQPNEFTSGKRGIPINGLIWMGSPDLCWSK